MATATASRLPARLRGKSGIAATAAVVVLIAMGLDTKVVSDGSAAAATTKGFSSSTFATQNFPRVQSLIEQKAVAATTLEAAIKADQNAAAQKYANSDAGSPVFSVKFTATADKTTDNITVVTVPGLPSSLTVRLQTGPAINGTDVRDATGTVTFEQFTDQIQYQDAGAALNDAVRQQVLSKFATGSLSGKQVTVIGAFTLIDPDNWLVTPVSLAAS